jgi:Zn-finger nucleic acid-binding protein
MKCPVDDTVLQMTDRQGIEIDYCPQCRGVWLDRGELDKLIERSAANAGGSVPPPQPRPEYGEQTYPMRGYDDRHERRNSDYHRKRKKKDFLGELFDF